VKRFLGPDLPLFARWIDVLTAAFAGKSFSDIERDIQRFRRALALGTGSDAELIQEFIKSRVVSLERQARIELAVMLAKESRLSQHSVSDITGVSRDTIRKYTADQVGSRSASRKRSAA
jgi:hypothetical protein